MIHTAPITLPDTLNQGQPDMIGSRIAALLLASALTALAQEDAQFATWMKASGRAFGILSKLDTKTGKEAVSTAETLGGVYEEMIGYWRQRNLTDAVKWSEQGKAAAVELAAAAFSGDTQRAGEAMKTIGNTCQACHSAYREKLPDGSYRFKPPAPKQ